MQFRAPQTDKSPTANLDEVCCKDLAYEGYLNHQQLTIVEEPLEIEKEHIDNLYRESDHGADAFEKRKQQNNFGGGRARTTGEVVDEEQVPQDYRRSNPLSPVTEAAELGLGIFQRDVSQRDPNESNFDRYLSPK